MAEHDLRLIIISRSNPHSQFLSQISRKNVKKVIYTYDSTSLDDILSFIIAELGGKKVDNVAFVVHATDKEIHLVGVGSGVLSCERLLTEKSLREFFVCLSSTFMNVDKKNARLDFLNTQLKDDTEAAKLSHELQKLTSCPVSICRDIHGSNIKAAVHVDGTIKSIPIMELYFLPEKLDEFLNSSMHSHMQNLSGYEKIRTVGKGVVLMLTTPDDPYQSLYKLRHRKSKFSNVMYGRYKLVGSTVMAIVKKLNNEPSTSPASNFYRCRRPRQANVQEMQDQTFHVELEVKNVKKRLNCQLTWNRYSIHVIYRNGEETVSNFDLIPSNFPSFWFSRVKSFAAESESPLN